ACSCPPARMLAMKLWELACTGAPLMSVFDGLSAGKTAHALAGLEVLVARVVRVGLGGVGAGGVVVATVGAPDVVVLSTVAASPMFTVASVVVADERLSGRDSVSTCVRARIAATNSSAAPIRSAWRRRSGSTYRASTRAADAPRHSSMDACLSD